MIITLLHKNIIVHTAASFYFISVAVCLGLQQHITKVNKQPVYQYQLIIMLLSPDVLSVFFNI